VLYKDLYVVPIEVGSSVILNNIFFDTDKAILRDESFPELDRLLALFEDVPDLKVEIAGHTDSDGSDAYNEGLSNRRANAVRDYLISKGIGEEHIVAKGYGEIQPIATNDTDDGKQQNRRVEFVILEI
jgi:OmpA-OmpF porin, OOP family